MYRDSEDWLKGICKLSANSVPRELRLEVVDSLHVLGVAVEKHAVAPEQAVAFGGERGDPRVELVARVEQHRTPRARRSCEQVVHVHVQILC